VEPGRTSIEKYPQENENDGGYCHDADETFATVTQHVNVTNARTMFP